MPKKSRFAQRFWLNLSQEFSSKNFVREFVRETATVSSVFLAVWLAGIGPAFVTFLSVHQPQLIIALVLYLLFGYLGWVPFAVFALILGASLVRLKQRQERSAARE